MNVSQYLRAVELLQDGICSKEYPFSLPVVRAFTRLEFDAQVTILVGENGSGKSTLLEALAVAWGFNPEGGTRNFNFVTRSSHSCLHEHLRLLRGIRRPNDGFFLRAESFYNLATEIDALQAEQFYGGRSLHAQSHGEAFFSTFMNRFGGNGLYILDEPEAALSPMRQLALLARMHDLVKQNSQFIVATHSPIVLGYPGAQILQLMDGQLRAVEYEQTEQYVIMKEFINRRERMLDMLLERGGDNE